MARVTEKSGYGPRDEGPRVKYSISWFEGSSVGSVCMRVSMNPIVIFGDTIFSDGCGMFPEKPLEMERAGGVSLCLL